MTAKEFLRGIKDNNKRINALIQLRDRYMDLAMRSTSIAQGRKGINEYSRVEAIGCRLAELEGDIDRQIDKYVDETRLANAYIDGITDRRLQDVLRYRYLNGWAWEKICEEMGYEPKYIYRLHGVALAIFDVLLKRGYQKIPKDTF